MEKDSVRRPEPDRVVAAVMQNWRKDWRTPTRVRDISRRAAHFHEHRRVVPQGP
jgi:hypothetical protein